MRTLTRYPAGKHRNVKDCSAEWFFKHTILVEEVKVMSLVQTRVKWSFSRHWCKALIAHLARSATALVLRRRVWTITHSISRLRNCLFTLLGLPCCRCQMALKVRQIWKMRRRMWNYKLRWQRQRQRRHPEILVHLQTSQHKGKWKVEVIIVHSLAETTTETTLKGSKDTAGSVRGPVHIFIWSCPVDGQCLSRRPQVVHTQLLDFFSWAVALSTANVASALTAVQPGIPRRRRFLLVLLRRCRRL